MRLLAAAVALAAVAADRRELAPAPSPPDNPLKGLVPYSAASAEDRARFPHTLEFFYLPLGKLVTGPKRYDWAPLEKELDAVAGRGCQAVFRVYLEYPKQAGVIPKYLLDGGLKVHKYVNTNTAPLPPEVVETPDYADPALRACLKDFIAALGARYDGDRRVGFLTAGLLGTWGEWHTYPRDDLAPSKAVEAEVMDAYAAAFRVTPVLLRYPAGAEDDSHAANGDRPFGYHDDSFAWATLPTGKPGDDWFYLAALKRAGPKAVAKWRTQPVGGEVRPETWGIVYDPKPGRPEVQDFRTCVVETHATWLMDTGVFGRKYVTPARTAKAVEEVRRMGYDITAKAVTLRRMPDGTLTVGLELANRGVAPFYADWRPEYAALDAAKAVVKSWPGRGTLAGFQPGDRVWADRLDLTGLPAGSLTLAVRVANPLPGGKPVRFGNAAQDADRAGWLTLGAVPAGPP